VTDTDQRSALPGAATDPVADAVRAALVVPGVASVRVDADEDGAALLRLELHDGADEDEVARAVEAELRRAATVPAAPVPPPAPLLLPLTVPAPSPSPEPRPAAGEGAAPARSTDVPLTVPQQLGRPAPRLRSGRVPVPSVSSPTVAATPAPHWLGETPGEDDAAPVGRPEPVADRIVLQRVQVATEGLTTTATVVLGRGAASHTGVADCAATPTGGHRALATATVRALESAAGGRLRAEVDAVSVADLAGRSTALVQLSMVTAGGPEQLVGAALTGADSSGGVVKAVLAACNRRVVPDAPDPATGRGRTRR
jgi:hypothetical protein